jgi:hypothetical protein
VNDRGQASTEYVAILLVVGALLAAAAAVAAVPGVGERVVATVRTGLCIVGGDVCRSSDAAAAGLAPCVTSARSSRENTTLDIAVVRLGENGEWQLALQSDGQALVTRLDEAEAGGTVGIGVEFSPAGVDADASAAVVAGYHGGRAWRFADARAASAFLDRAMRDGSSGASRAPNVRWHAIGGRTDAQAGVAIANLARAGVSTSANSVIGLRTDGARRTLTLDLGVDEPRFFADLPGFPAASGKRRSWVADVTWEGGAAREIALRAAVAGGDRLDELTARLDLRDAGNRAVAARLLRPGLSKLADLRALSARMRSHGVVELSGYRVSERRRGFSLSTKLGVGLGLSHHRISSERRLAEAVAWVRGGPAQRRFDCLGV